MKKLFFGLLLVLFFGFVSADAIIDLTLPENIPLNQYVSATGVFQDDEGYNADQLCSFFFWNDLNMPVVRATDEWTNSTGRFSTTSLVLKEPLFERGRTYSLRVECGNTFETAYFVVGQKQEAIDLLGYKVYPQAVGYDMHYWTNPDYIFSLMYGILFLALVVYFVWRFWNS